MEPKEYELLLGFVGFRWLRRLKVVRRFRGGRDYVQVRLCRTGVADTLVVLPIRQRCRGAVVTVHMATRVTMIGRSASKDRRHGKRSHCTQQSCRDFHTFPPVLRPVPPFWFMVVAIAPVQFSGVEMISTDGPMNPPTTCSSSASD